MKKVKIEQNYADLLERGICKATDTFGCDMDGVVLPCDELIVEDINKKYGTKFTIDDIGTYGPTGNSILDKKFEYYSDPAFVISQKPYDGAVNFINELKKRCDVFFCTAVNANCLTVRAAEAQRDFGIPASQIITCTRKDLITCKFFLDDSSYNINRSKAEYPILFRRPWNYDVSGSMSVTKYEDVLCFVDFIQNRKLLTRIPENAIICLVGPTGSGKTCMTDALVQRGYTAIKTIKGTLREGSDRHIGTERFNELEKEGYFAETTVYAGVKYGIAKETLNNIAEDEKAVVCVDICGAMALKNIFGDRCVIVFCDTDKEQSIQYLINKEDITPSEKVKRISSLDAEFGNKRFCDFKVNGVKDLLATI